MTFEDDQKLEQEAAKKYTSREKKRRRSMQVTGKSVFMLQQLMARPRKQPHGQRRRGNP